MFCCHWFGVRLWNRKWGLVDGRCVFFGCGNRFVLVGGCPLLKSYKLPRPLENHSQIITVCCCLVQLIGHGNGVGARLLRDVCTHGPTHYFYFVLTAIIISACISASLLLTFHKALTDVYIN